MAKKGLVETWPALVNLSLGPDSVWVYGVIKTVESSDIINFYGYNQLSVLFVAGLLCMVYLCIQSGNSQITSYMFILTMAKACSW